MVKYTLNYFPLVFGCWRFGEWALNAFESYVKERSPETWEASRNVNQNSRQE